MEEILASIRRIIADDQSAKTQQETAAADELPTPDTMLDEAADDILDLAQVEESSSAQAPHDLDDVDFREPVRQTEPHMEVVEAAVPEPQPVREPVMEHPAPMQPAVQRPLLAPNTDAVVSAAFGSLASTVLTNNARTLEDLVQDMLRPMLKSWLDDNLPSIVERLVRAEIERVARNSRG